MIYIFFWGSQAMKGVMNHLSNMPAITDYAVDSTVTMALMVRDR